MDNRKIQSLYALGKLAIAGASLVAIGWAVITFYPSTGVKESDADIYWNFQFERDSTQKFAETLKELGHAPPRSYDFNGNTVFFSSKETTQSPEEVLREYQRIFTRNGINERPYLESSSDGGPRAGESDEDYFKLTRERGLAMLSGQLVPSLITPSHVSMGGGLIKGSPSTCDAAEKVLEQNAAEGKADFEDLFQGYRAIEATRDEGDTHTQVTATWSDDKLDIRKHIPSSRQDYLAAASPDPIVPSCPGCTRLNRFAGQGDEEAYVTNVFRSPQHQDSVVDFYLKAMANRGWQETEASAITRQALQHTTLRDNPTQAVQLVRGEEFITVAVDPADRGSLVTTVSAN